MAEPVRRRRRADAARLTKRITLNVDEDTHARMDEAADRLGVTAASVARLALAAGLPSALRTLRRERARSRDTSATKDATD